MEEIVEAGKRFSLTFVVLTASISALASAAVTYKVTVDQLGEKLKNEADVELQKAIDEAKEFYKTLNKKEEYNTPSEALEALHPEVAEAAQALVNYSARSKREPVVEPPPREMEQNVFADMAVVPKPFILEEEDRTPDKPYLISATEFAEAEFEYDQVSCTYYEGDGILADTSDHTIDDIDKKIGNDNLLRFGVESDDPNIVYVRNVKLMADFEIARSSGKYGEEVLGIGVDEDEPYIRHMNSTYDPRKINRVR